MTHVTRRGTTGISNSHPVHSPTACRAIVKPTQIAEIAIHG